MLYDCGAKFRKTSINDNLLQDPDLCNNLIGVMFRFRQELMCASADVKGIFHQVFASDQDRNALKFLRRPDNNMKQIVIM